MRTATRTAAKAAPRAKSAAPRGKAATERKPARAASERAAPRKVDGRSTNGRKPGRPANGAGRASLREPAPETMRKPRRAKGSVNPAEQAGDAAPAAPKKRGRPRAVIETPAELTPAQEHQEETADMSEAEQS